MAKERSEMVQDFLNIFIGILVQDSPVNKPKTKKSSERKNISFKVEFVFYVCRNAKFY